MDPIRMAELVEVLGRVLNLRCGVMATFPIILLIVYRVNQRRVKADDEFYQDLLDHGLTSQRKDHGR